MYQHEAHKTHRSGWLRAAVMGANDGIVSTASLIIGVASAGSSLDVILLAGFAGLVAGAMSMAAGEYVSVSTQADLEEADLQIERDALAQHEHEETEELAQIYVQRGLEPSLALQVARQLMAHDALGAHARDEIGITESSRARPITAALSSAVTFAVGAALPMLATLLLPLGWTAAGVALSSLLFLALLGWLAARAGGASPVKGSLRVGFWGALAMLLTFLVGTAFGVAA
ncbi:MAG: VIT1/CCC1 transporter family protein [Pseudohongiellaceae bacterium]